MQTYLLQKKPITNRIKLKKENRKLTITLVKWAKPYHKLVKQLGLFKKLLS